MGLGDPSEEGIVKSYEETMRILEAFDLTGSYRAAAALAGCDHHTVARCIAARDAGRGAAEPAEREHVADAFVAKIEEWVERSRGRVRGNIAHDRLTALGYTGSERSTRRSGIPAFLRATICPRTGRVGA